MLDNLLGPLFAFGWGLAAAATLPIGAGVGYFAGLPHAVIARIMALGAGLLLAAASVELAAHAAERIGEARVLAGVLIGGAAFSSANALLVMARDRKRCGMCRPQLSETDAEGSGLAIAMGTALDAIPEALVLGVTLKAAGPQPLLLAAVALANLPEALSASAGMRSARRSAVYVFGLWTAIALATGLITAFAYASLGGVGEIWIESIKAVSAGALIAMAAETMIPEAFHNSPRYSGLLAAGGFGALLLLSALFR
jgi:ZIP family zinc transporter